MTVHPRLKVSRSEKRPNYLPNYQLPGASSSAVLALWYLQERRPPLCVLTVVVFLPEPAPLAAVPKPKLAPTRRTAKGACAAGLESSTEMQCTVGGDTGI